MGVDVSGPDRPRVDVVVVNWNGGRFLPECLRALSASTVKPDVVVVDNASTDDSVALLRRDHPAIELVALDANLGYAAGANEGIRRGHAPYVLVMNPDVRLAPDHIERLVERLEAEPAIGLAQGRLLAIGEREFIAGSAPRTVLLDSAGHSLRRSRMVVDRGQGQPDGPVWAVEVSVFSVCGAAMMMRRRTLEDLAEDGAAFDPAFFAYKEDIDLCWRSRLLGWDIRYVPAAVAWHVRGVPLTGGTPPMPAPVRRRSWMNHWLMMVKNDRLPDVLLHLPWIAAWELLRAGHAALRDPRLLPAYLQICRLLPHAVRERTAIQAKRRTGGREIRRWFGADSQPVPVVPHHATLPNRSAE